MAATIDIKNAIWQKAEDMVTVTSTEKDVFLSKFWINRTSVKTIALEPILALTLLSFQNDVNTFWEKIKGETSALVKNHKNRITSDVVLDLDKGLSIRGHIAEEKPNKGRAEDERRLFLNVSLRDSRKAWGTTLITFTAKEFDGLVEILKELAHFFSYFKLSTQHVASHNDFPCRICGALEYSPLSIHIIDATKQAATYITALAASYVKKFMDGVSGELRLIISGKAPSALKANDPGLYKKDKCDDLCFLFSRLSLSSQH